MTDVDHDAIPNELHDHLEIDRFRRFFIEAAGILEGARKIQDAPAMYMRKALFDLTYATGEQGDIVYSHIGTAAIHLLAAWMRCGEGPPEFAPTYNEIAACRQYQDNTWGPEHDDGHDAYAWLAIINKYISCAQQCLVLGDEAAVVSDDADLETVGRDKLAQATALCFAWLRSLDRIHG